MPLVRATNSGAKTILAHFHYCYKGQQLFTKQFDWESPRVRRMAKLDPEQTSFMAQVRDLVVERGESPTCNPGALRPFLTVSGQRRNSKPSITATNITRRIGTPANFLIQTGRPATPWSMHLLQRLGPRTRKWSDGAFQEAQFASGVALPSQLARNPSLWRLRSGVWPLCELPHRMGPPPISMGALITVQCRVH